MSDVLRSLPLNLFAQTLRSPGFAQNFLAFERCWE